MKSILLFEKFLSERWARQLQKSVEGHFRIDKLHVDANRVEIHEGHAEYHHFEVLSNKQHRSNLHALAHRIKDQLNKIRLASKSSM